MALTTELSGDLRTLFQTRAAIQVHSRVFPQPAGQIPETDVNSIWLLSRTRCTTTTYLL